MEPRNRLAEVFADLGFPPKVTDEQLDKWGMTRNRWNQLVQNTGKVPMTVSEANLLKKWLHDKFQGKNQYLFETDMPVHLRSKQTALPLQ